MRFTQFAAAATLVAMAAAAPLPSSSTGTDAVSKMDDTPSITGRSQSGAGDRSDRGSASEANGPSDKRSVYVRSTTGTTTPPTTSDSNSKSTTSGDLSKSTTSGDLSSSTSAKGDLDENAVCLSRPSYL